MQVHGDDVVAARRLQHVGHEFGRDGGARLVFLVLARVREVGDDGGDAARRGRLARVDHDQELHQPVVDVARRGGLEDEDCRVGEDDLAVCVGKELRKSVGRVVGQWGGVDCSGAGEGDGGGRARTVFVPHRLADRHGRLLVRVLKNHDLRQLDTQPRGAPGVFLALGIL